MSSTTNSTHMHQEKNLQSESCTSVRIACQVRETPHSFDDHVGRCTSCIPLTFVHGQQQVVSGTQILIHFIKAPDMHNKTHDSLCFSPTRPNTTRHRCQRVCKNGLVKILNHRGVRLPRPMRVTKGRTFQT